MTWKTPMFPYGYIKYSANLEIVVVVLHPTGGLGAERRLFGFDVQPRRAEI
jgi:hypothetical protein